MVTRLLLCWDVFFVNDTATTEIYTLSLHDALPIFVPSSREAGQVRRTRSGSALRVLRCTRSPPRPCSERSEEHTSELQSQSNLVCRLLLEKKNTIQATSRNRLI